MFSLFKNNPIIYAPVNGKIIKLSNVNDYVFSTGMMGKGIAFDSQDEYILAPCNSEVLLIASTKHAIGLKTKNGGEVLIHIGLDTMNLNGVGFEVLVEKGNTIKKGDKIIKLDRNFFNTLNLDMTICMVVTNSKDKNVNILLSDGVTCAGQTAVMSCNKR